MRIPLSRRNRSVRWLVGLIVAGIAAAASVTMLRTELGGAPRSASPLMGNPFSEYGYEAGGPALGDWNGSDGIVVSPTPGARFGIGVAIRNASGSPMTITGVRGADGVISLTGVELRPYSPPTGGLVGPPIVRSPYDATGGVLRYRLPPGAWVAMELDFRISNPCAGIPPRTHLVYDRSVGVVFSQDGRTHSHTVDSVPLNITSPATC
jgi:hypothetical protein